jgi:hypothetical protein
MPNYNATIIEFQWELDRLIQQRNQLENQIASLVKAMDAIKVLAEEADEDIIETPPPMTDSGAGFTDRVRAILKANPAKYLSAVMIRDVFVKDAPKDDPKILLIHTTNTLKRLFSQGEVEEMATPEGRAYRWRFANHNALAERLRTLAPRADGLPNPFGNTLGEMLKEPKKK